MTWTEDPFLCDGGRREIATVTGADPGETVTIDSPKFAGGDSEKLEADSGGAVALLWRCEASESGLPVAVTAAAASGKSVSFEV